MATKAAGNFAGRVSHVLRNHVGGGFGAAQARVGQEGLMVMADTATRCTISARYDDEDYAERKTADAVLELKRAGYVVEPVADSKTFIYVQRGADLPDGWKKRKSILPGVTNWEHRWYPGWTVERRPASTQYIVTRTRTEDVPFDDLLDAIAYIVENGSRK